VRRLQGVLPPRGFSDEAHGGLLRRGREAREVMAVLERAFAGVQRNDPCPCGSGRKFKQCHGQMPRTSHDSQSCQERNLNADDADWADFR
jgi:hypothetical protein